MATIAELMLKADYRQISQADTALDKLSDTGSKATGVLKTLAATLGIAFGVREVLQAADAYKTLTNRLALVTTSTEQLAAAQSEVFRISQETRAPLQATAEVYQRLATNADQLGLTLTEVGQTTEQINKLMAISGTSAQSAEAALTQLGQAFASGTLRGEELNSVMEQAPALAKAIADGMGVTVGQLRQLGQDGKITASAVVEALKAQGDAIDSQFSRMVPTLSQATQQIGNSFVGLVGRIDSISGSTTGMGSAISDLAKAIDNLDLGPVVEITNAWGIAIGKIGEDIGRLRSTSSDVEGIWYRMFVAGPATVRAAFQQVGIEFGAIVDRMGAEADRLKGMLKSAWMPAIDGGSNLDKVAAEYEARINRINSVGKESVQGVWDERNASLELAKAKREIYEAEQKYLTGDTSSLSTGGGKPKVTTGGKAASGKSASEKAEIARSEWQAQIDAEIEAINRQSVIENEAYQNRRSWLEETFASDLEAENLRYEQRKLLLEEYLADAGLAEQDERTKREALEQEHQDRLLSIEKTASQKKRAGMQKALADTSALMNSHSRKLFEIGKAAAIANALISARESVVDAYKWGTKLGGPALGAAFGAAAAAAQAMNISAIASQSFGGSGNASSAGASSGTPDTSGIASSQSPAVRAQTVDIRIQGRGIWRDDDVAELMQAIGDKLGDGAKFGRVEFMRA